VVHWSAQVMKHPVDTNWLVLSLLVNKDVHQLVSLPESPTTKIGWLRELVTWTTTKINAILTQIYLLYFKFIW
jgi:hypothetical protein